MCGRYHDDGLERRLTDAARSESAERVKELIAAGADVNAKDEKGDTALMIATSRGYVEIAEILIDAGADVDTKNNEGKTALMIAVDIPDYSTDDDPGKQIDYRRSLWWIYRCRKKIVKVLIEAGADVNARDNEGRTALKIAAYRGHTDLVQLLKTAGTKG